jgi:hypothetical protein
MLTSRSWWVDVADRAARQGTQVLLPFLVLAASTGKIDAVRLRADLVIALVAAAVVVLRAVTGVRADAGAPWTVQVLDRAASAAAAALLGIFTASGFDLLTADGRAIALSAALSAGVALLQAYVQPPTIRGEVISVVDSPLDQGV